MWVRDADLAAAFDNINHEHLLSMLDGFPAKEHIRTWLAAGIMENGQYLPTAAGAPQGGLISPLLLNIAMYGMEEAAGVRRHAAHKAALGDRVIKGAPVLIRYADDLVALCHSEQEALAVQQRLAVWLRPAGCHSTRTRHTSCTCPKGSASWGSISDATPMGSC